MENNMFVTIAGIVAVTAIGCITYFHVVDSNNSKEIVSRAIERGLDPMTASCAANIATNNRDIRSTCEKMSIIKGKSNDWNFYFCIYFDRIGSLHWRTNRYYLVSEHTVPCPCHPIHVRNLGSCLCFVRWSLWNRSYKQKIMLDINPKIRYNIY